jgi:hypothetical protein
MLSKMLNSENVKTNQGESLEKKSWDELLQEGRKILDEQIGILEKVTQDNMNNAWSTVYGPLRLLFTIAKDHLECIDKIRTETLALREKDKVLEERVEKLKKMLEDLEHKAAQIQR